MRLIAAARRFDRLTFADAYVPATTFLGQMDVFDDSRRDGLTVDRRILSVDPAVTMPARKTLLVDGGTWLVGDSERDYFGTEAIRHKHVLHRASEIVAVKTFAETIAASAGYSAWASRIWVKGSKEIEISSDVTSVYGVYFAEGETLAEGTLIFMSGRWHLIQLLYSSTAGFQVALSDELPEPVRVSATFSKRVYVPSNDTYTTTPTAYSGVLVRWQSYFRYPQRGADVFKAGDRVLMVLKTDVTPVAGDKVSIGTANYVIKAILDEGLCWGTHLVNV